MEITHTALSTILDIMKRKGLDSSKFYLQFGTVEGQLAFCFTPEPIGEIQKFGELMVLKPVGSAINLDGLVVDFVEINGKQGLIFQDTGAVNVSHSDGKSSQ